jgi:hypothetical protein
MKPSFAPTAVKTAIRWLRWAAVLILVCFALDGLVYAALGPQSRAFRPALLDAVGYLLSMVHFHVLGETAIVVAGALIAPRARRLTAIVLAAVHIPLSFWNHVLSRVSLVELVLLEGPGNYRQFILESLGAVLGVVYIFWLQKANESAASAPPSQLSSPELPPASAGTKAAHTAVETAIHWLRWAAVLALVCSALGGLVYSALAGLVFSELGPQAPVVRPAPVALVQGLVSILLVHVLRETAFVVAGALIAPRFHLTTAIVLAALRVPFSFWAHVLATGGPWPSWTINYMHFSLETLGAMLGVVYIFWSERAKRSLTSLPPHSPPP